jgi:hypothetical protein
MARIAVSGLEKVESQDQRAGKKIGDNGRKVRVGLNFPSE